jgi:fibronectin type 3 domain-containing protein
MLHANMPNLFPPNGINASVHGNIVHLSWNRQDKDTHGYYLYKGNGFDGEMRLFSRLITSSENSVVYYDTLSISDTTRTLSYAVADVNTSYAISVPSERTTIQIPAGRIPFPTGLSARKTDKNVMLIWDDVMVTNENISGYQVYRSVEDPEGKQIEDRRLLSPGNNLYTHNYFNDSLARPGTTCVYEIRSVGLSPDIRSSFCQAVRLPIPAEVLLPPSNVKLFANGNQVVIQWDEPRGQEIDYILITRIGSDKKVHELRAGSASDNEWTDTGLKSGETYYYQLTTVDKNGRESKATEPIGIIPE